MPTKKEIEHGLELYIKEPREYKVFLLNDDYTSMEFVVEILVGVFHKSHQEAEIIMMKVHQEGRGLCGVYSYEIAEAKVYQVSKRARNDGFPLSAIMEEL